MSDIQQGDAVVDYADFFGRDTAFEQHGSSTFGNRYIMRSLRIFPARPNAEGDSARYHQRRSFYDRRKSVAACVVSVNQAAPPGASSHTAEAQRAGGDPPLFGGLKQRGVLTREE